MDVIKLKGINGRFVRHGDKILTVEVVEKTANPHLVITKTGDDWVTITHVPTTFAIPYLLTLAEARALAKAIANLDCNFSREVYREPFPHHPTIDAVRKIIKRRGLHRKSAEREE